MSAAATRCSAPKRRRPAATCPLWLDAGIRRFRLEFVHESAEQVARVTRAFEDVLAGRKTPAELGEHLRRLSPQGTTEGSLYIPEGYRTLPVLQ